MPIYKLHMRSFAPWKEFGALSAPSTMYVPRVPTIPVIPHPAAHVAPVTFAGGFHGDARGFSLETNAPGITARINAYLEVDLASATSGKSKAWCDASRGPWMAVGPTASAVGTVRSDFSVRPVAGSRAVKVVIEYAASNPLVALSPDIDARAEFTFSRSDGSLSIDTVITGDQFPACECFIEDPAGGKIFLGGFAPPSKGEIMRLFGRLNKPQKVWYESYVVVTTDARGAFQRLEGSGSGSNTTGPACEALLQSVSDWNARTMGAIPMPSDAP